MQDFAAKVLCDNLQALATWAAQDSANLPPHRRINRAYVYCVLTPLLPALLLARDVAHLLLDALALMARHTCRHKEGLSKPRKPRHKPHKHMTQKAS